MRYSTGRPVVRTKTTRKLKRPDGALIEEFVTSTVHVFQDGEYAMSNSVPEGEYTGVFWFEHVDGRATKRYTRGTAPKWLSAFYDEAAS